jgi:hypothetical protein
MSESEVFFLEPVGPDGLDGALASFLTGTGDGHGPGDTGSLGEFLGYCRSIGQDDVSVEPENGTASLGQGPVSPDVEGHLVLRPVAWSINFGHQMAQNAREVCDVMSQGPLGPPAVLRLARQVLPQFRLANANGGRLAALASQLGGRKLHEVLQWLDGSSRAQENPPAPRIPGSYQEQTSTSVDMSSRQREAGSKSSSTGNPPSSLKWLSDTGLCSLPSPESETNYWLCLACSQEPPKQAKCWTEWVDYTTGQKWACRRYAS